GGLFFLSHVCQASCVEVSDIVGAEKCRRYGDTWSVEGRWPLNFSFGARYSEFSPAGLRFQDRYNGNSIPYSFDGAALGVSRLAGMGIGGGLTFYVWGQMYTGMDGGLEWGSIESATIKAKYAILSNSSGLDVQLFHGGVPIGYRIPLGRASLRG